jgi:hypothetical protein
VHLFSSQPNSPPPINFATHPQGMSHCLAHIAEDEVPEDLALAKREFADATKLLERAGKVAAYSNPLYSCIDTGHYMAMQEYNRAFKVLKAVEAHYNINSDNADRFGGLNAETQVESRLPAQTTPAQASQVSLAQRTQGNVAQSLGSPIRLQVPQASQPLATSSPGQVGPVTPTPSPVGQAAQVNFPPVPFPPNQAALLTSPITPKKAKQPASDAGGSNLPELSSPFPDRRHYAVTVGRHTGVYSSWYVTFRISFAHLLISSRALAKPMIDGLGSVAVYQGFATYPAALDAYLTACEKGFVQIERLPSDTEEKWGQVDYAEDV